MLLVKFSAKSKKESSMTPTTELTLEGFLRGLQSNITSLVGTFVFVLVMLFIVKWFIKKLLETEGLTPKEAVTARLWANSSFFLVIVLVLIGFSMNAVTYATNTIPRVGLDGSSIYEDMDANIEEN
ncbi:hypothetical protein COB52_03615 [Candidatus Kaiserbacteria bacterium]|nr:MAG: hypothetical protein COB52_03615 [Candidatus Kaiserbacteria bacterium]